MKQGVKPLSATGIWSQLICGSAAIGVVMGLFEVCWTYLLPIFFPYRRYRLPIETIDRFVLIAIATDVFIMLAFATLLGVLTSGVRKLWWRARSFRYWLWLVHLLLIVGALSYLYVGILYSYFNFRSERLKLQAVVIGILLIMLTSIVLVWLLQMLLRRFGKAALVATWIFALVVLICTTAPNYLHYRLVNPVETDMPVLNTVQAPSVLLVTLDTLRADHLACYGSKVVQTPVLDALAVDGCLLEAAFAQAPTTTASHCSIMTSTYVAHHGGMNGCAMKVGIPTLAEILRANGYETAAFISATVLRSGVSGLNRGFDYYEDSICSYTTFFWNDEYQFVLAAYLLAKIENSQIPGYIVTNRALSWLEERGREPFFCWLHYYDPHEPYEAPNPYKDMYEGKINPALPSVFNRSRYAGEVTYTDAQLGRIIKYLKNKELYNDMLIIVTADHGEAFGEKHGNITEYYHQWHLYDTTQHVPLIIKLPGGRGAGRRVADVVQLVDLAPTVLHYLGGSSPRSFEGRSLLDLLNGEQRSEHGTAYAETEPRVEKRLRAIRTPNIKYICDATGKWQELYDVASDPTETVNIYREKLDLAKTCYEQIQYTLGEPADTNVATFDPKVREQLRSLGYID